MCKQQQRGQVWMIVFFISILKFAKMSRNQTFEHMFFSLYIYGADRNSPINPRFIHFQHVMCCLRGHPKSFWLLNGWRGRYERWESLPAVPAPAHSLSITWRWWQRRKELPVLHLIQWKAAEQCCNIRSLVLSQIHISYDAFQTNGRP